MVRLRVLSLLLLICAIGVGSCGEEPGEPLAAPNTGVIVGTVRRLGACVGAEVSLYRHRSLDPLDPFAPFRGFELERLKLRPAAASRPPVATQEVGDDGRFRFEGLGAGLYEVHARSSAPAWEAETVVVPVVGAHVEAAVHLPCRTATLEGRVVCKDGAPFDGVVEVLAGVSRGLY